MALDENGLVYAEHMPHTIGAATFIGFLQNLVQILQAGERGAPGGALPQDTILILDNARAHTGLEVYKHCEQAGINALTLPAYSPELQPVEKFFLALQQKNQAKLAQLR